MASGGSKSKSSSKPVFDTKIASQATLGNTFLNSLLFGGPTFGALAPGVDPRFPGGLSPLQVAQKGLFEDPSIFQNPGAIGSLPGLFGGIPGLFSLTGPNQEILSRSDASLESIADRLEEPIDPARIARRIARNIEPITQTTEKGRQRLIDTEIQRGGGNVQFGSTGTFINDLLARGEESVSRTASATREAFDQLGLQQLLQAANIRSSLATRKEQAQQAALRRRITQLLQSSTIFANSVGLGRGQSQKSSSSGGNGFGSSFASGFGSSLGSAFGELF